MQAFLHNQILLANGKTLIFGTLKMKNLRNQRETFFSKITQMILNLEQHLFHIFSQKCGKSASLSKYKSFSTWLILLEWNYLHVFVTIILTFNGVVSATNFLNLYNKRFKGLFSFKTMTSSSYLTKLKNYFFSRKRTSTELRLNYFQRTTSKLF